MTFRKNGIAKGAVPMMVRSYGAMSSVEGRHTGALNIRADRCESRQRLDGSRGDELTRCDDTRDLWSRQRYSAPT